MNYFDLAKSFSPIARKEQTALCLLAQQGDKSASEKLVMHNLRLAINVARKHQRNGIELEDLIATAAGAILDAIRVFDPASKANFPTVARQWMVARCQEVVKASNAASGDDRVTRALYNKMQKVTKQLRADGLDVTVANVANSLNIPEGKVLAAWPVVMGNATSLSAPCGSDDAGTFGDTLSSKTLNQFEKLARTRKSEKVAALLTEFVMTLSLRDRHIFEARNLAEYLGNEPVGQQELAIANGISKPRVSQIEKALNRKCAEFLKNNNVSA